MFFKKHSCTLGLGSDSMLPKSNGMIPQLWRNTRKLVQVSQHHPETYEFFYSYPALMAERQRHLYEVGNCLIHPYSLFSISWKLIISLINLAHMCLSPFRLFYIAVPIDELKPHFLDYILLALNMVCWLDIAINFNMGYVESNTMNIVMDRKLISGNYLKRWFFFDLFSSQPIAIILLSWRPHQSRYILFAHALSLLRTSRIYSICNNLKVFTKIFTSSYIWHGVLWQIILFLVSCHWCSCLLYLPPIIELYWSGNISGQYNSFLNSTSPARIVNFPVDELYKKSMFISVSAFFGTGYTMYNSTTPAEIFLHSLVIIYAAVFMIYNFVFVLKVYLTIYNSTMRYNDLVNQVEEYMRHRQFPLPLKKRVRAFYYYRYQAKYYNEKDFLESLSEGLRNEITLHTCHKLVHKVALFEGVAPSVMGTILGCLLPEVYLPNESVVRAGEIGDCMFFVANGTVAVYSLKGVEVCHLEDGAHFGEVALLMKDSKRVATVIAVEITLLYRLEIEDFKQFIMKDEMLCERVEALAAQRMHETVILDEDRREAELSKDRTHSEGFIDIGTSKEKDYYPKTPR